MDKLDKYLKTHEYIIYNKLIKNNEKFNYGDEDDLILDLDLLLSVKYKNIKVYKTKKHYLKGEEYNYIKLLRFNYLMKGGDYPLIRTI